MNVMNMKHAFVIFLFLLSIVLPLVACEEKKPISEQQVIEIAWQALDPNTSSHNRTAWEIITVEAVTGREAQDRFEGEPGVSGWVPGPTPPNNESITPDGSYWYVEMQPVYVTPKPVPTELFSPTAPPNIPEPFIFQANFLIDAITGQIIIRKFDCPIY